VALDRQHRSGGREGGAAQRVAERGGLVDREKRRLHAHEQLLGSAVLARDPTVQAVVVGGVGRRTHCSIPLIAQPPERSLRNEEWPPVGNGGWVVRA
jgi:hypothetical protein